MKHEGFEFTCHGHKLFGQSWSADQPRGLVVLVHGMGEHGGRYSSSLVPDLVSAGFVVFATDHFGHGHSEGKRGYCPGYEAVLDSVEMTLELAGKSHPCLPVFLYGHSMGGNVVLGYTMKRKPAVKGVVSTSPFLRMAFEPPAWKMAMGKILRNLIPSLTMPSGLNPEHISRDPREVKKYKEDPLVHEKVSPNFVFPFLKAGEWILAHPEEMGVPLLLCHGTGDQITSHWATKALAKQMGKADLELFEGGYHELHNDYGKEEMKSRVVQWLEQNLQE
ncbi:alpha/beta hydrolase [Robertkochia flava]|uniref:alpha/beta hydrolase n=1 Tax=Robertkochia flava TaxID=3447986 RepID=UPI001CCCA94E|nr:alpha/beta hydrolase [Robertkochia marina]